MVEDFREGSLALRGISAIDAALKFHTQPVSICELLNGLDKMPSNLGLLESARRDSNP